MLLNKNKESLSHRADSLLGWREQTDRDTRATERAPPPPSPRAVCVVESGSEERQLATKTGPSARN